MSVVLFADFPGFYQLLAPKLASIVIIFALLSPYISTFTELLKFVMLVIICLPYCTFDIRVYLISLRF